MTLNVVSAEVDEVTVIKAGGDLDYHSFRVLKNALEKSLDQGATRLLMDLSEIAYLDSAALGSLLYSQKRIQERQGRLVLIASNAIFDILRLTHLDSYFELADSTSDAMERLAFPEQGSVVEITTKSHDSD